MNDITHVNPNNLDLEFCGGDTDFTSGNSAMASVRYSGPGEYNITVSPAYVFDRKGIKELRAYLKEVLRDTKE